MTVRFTRQSLSTVVLVSLFALHPAWASDVASTARDQAALNGQEWAVQLPVIDGPVAFRGAVSYDKAGGGAGGMVYPAVGGPIGLLAAIATHGLISEASKSSEKSQMRAKADKVLAPYQQQLSAYRYKDLLALSFGKAGFGIQKPLTPELGHNAGWLIECQPQFVMTQDQSALILENTVSIRKPVGGGESVYRNTVRVVSKGQQAQDLTEFWGADQGLNLKTASARLFVQSIDMALADSQRAVSESFPRKTIRYIEGTDERMERAEVIEERCGRAVGRTLRGWLLSVPVSGDGANTATGGEGCE